MVRHEEKVFVGLDIGATNLIVASANENGRIVKRERAPTPMPLDKGLSLADEMIASVTDGAPISSMGAGQVVPGLENGRCIAIASNRMAQCPAQGHNAGKVSLPLQPGCGHATPLRRWPSTITQR